MIKQTDFAKDNIRKYGCLFFSLLKGIENKYQHTFTFEDITKIYHHLVIEKIMGITCYVIDHDALLNHVIKEHMRIDQTAKYLGAEYLPGSGRDSWGVKRGANHIILQFKTKNFSHFRCLNYDPYYPPPKLLWLMSVRYYKI